MASDLMQKLIGQPVCQLRRFTKESANAAYFCPQCKHFSKADECPFREQSGGDDGR